MRKGRAVLTGLGAGLVLLALVLLPILWNHLKARHLGRISQDRLVSAGGDARAAMGEHPLLILPREAAKLPKGTSVSLNGHQWYTLPTGGVVLREDAASWSQVYAASGNRIAILPIDDAARQRQQIEVDLALAPQIPELVFFEGLKSGGEAVLPVTNTAAVELIPALPGLEHQLRGEKLSLQMPQDLMQRRFFCFRVQATNEQGRALCMVAVLPEREDAYTPIHTAEELQAIRLRPNGAYRLMNDIDLSGLAWQPIGSEHTPFCGLLDGGGHAITGLHWPPKGRAVATEDHPGFFALFGYVKHGILRNLRIINPQIDGRGVGEGRSSTAALALLATQSLVENCQVLGGQIVSDRNRVAGVMLEAADSVLLHLFNSSEVTALLPASMMQDSGGIAGAMNGYMAYCANEGNVSASHLIGGLFGWGNKAVLSHCINSGEINGFPFIGAYPPGALFQTLDGDYASNCCFVEGNAARAGSAYLQSGISNIQVISPEDLSNSGALSTLGAFEGEDAQWMLDETIARGPIPRGIYTLKLYRPGGETDE